MTSHHFSIRFVSFAALAFAVWATGACGGEDLDRNEAGRAFASTSLALTNVQTTADSSASGGTVTATADCSGGGTASVSGDWDNADSFSVDVVFDACTESQITIDGDLHFSASITDTTVTTSMVGTLSYSGAVNGTCDIDVETSSSSESVSVEGSVCGQSVTQSVGTGT